MKEIRKISLILVMILFMMMVTVNAASTCKINLEPQKNNISKDEEFVVDVEISNITAPDGVITFGGTLEYDKDALTFVKMEPQGDWTAPSYNEENGKFIMDRKAPTTSNEKVLQITFKVKDDTKKSASVSIKEMSSSDGVDDITIENVATFVTIKEASTPGTNTTPSTNTTPDTNTTPGTNTTLDTNTSSETNSNTNKNTNTSTNSNSSSATKDGATTKKELPKAGNGSYIILALLVVAVVLGIVFFVKNRKLDI